MARFSICGGGDDGEGSSSQGSRKRQRLPSIEEESDAGSSGEENDEETREAEEEDNNCRGGRRMVSDDGGGSTSDDSDREVVIEETRFVNSVNSESSSSNKDSSLFVTLLDSDVLDCPICCEPLKTPIFQCDNGHLACSVCCTKVRNRCPCCTLPIGYIRCRAMEKVIETSRVSCTNAKYGCKQNMLYGNRFHHEKLCVFTPCSCPIHNCNYTGYYKDVNNHVRLKHKDDVIPFVWDASVRISLDIDQKTTVFQEEKSGEVIVVQLFQGLHVVYVTVSCIRPLSPVVGTLSCYLVNVTVDSSLKQVFKVKNIQKVGNEHPKDGFMVIPSYMLSGEFRISIGRSRFLL
ncbi:hypothetical protein AALP_AA6G352900 [Arabis alpina]|uniref:RING-type E3 ubiquitin transferase n=1 Tax=Arabis alpina TaxID=50452 RepID=A0A087GTR8_ARAAL|nr:hypothetical protein AALP_AA6G352900 [Arabis alpina]